MSAVAAGALAMLAGVCTAVTPDEPPEPFRLTDPRIVESSSLVVARTEPDLVLTANDGPSTHIYAVDMTTGDTVGTTTLAGIAPLDLEAMTPGPDGALYLGDIGDNDSSRDLVSVYRIDEPGRRDATVQPQRFDLAYPDGPRDAEALIVEPRSGRLIVVSKEVPIGTVYVAPTELSSSAVNRLRAIATAPALVTAAQSCPAVTRSRSAPTPRRPPTSCPAGPCCGRGGCRPNGRGSRSRPCLPPSTSSSVAKDPGLSCYRYASRRLTGRVPPPHHRPSRRQHHQPGTCSRTPRSLPRWPWAWSGQLWRSLPGSDVTVERTAIAGSGGCAPQHPPGQSSRSTT